MPRSLPRLAALAALVALVPALAGMGVIGEERTGRIPKTLEAFVAAEVVDAAGTRVRLEKINIDGDEFLRGRLGKGVVVIPFARIRAIEFGATEGRFRRAQATLADGRAVEVEVDVDTEFSGASEFGTYYVQVRDLRAVAFDTPPAPPPAEGAAPARDTAQAAPRIPGL